MTNVTDTWFHSSPVYRRVDLKIFCFPYAGGTASIYRNWTNLLPSNVQVISVELPGRGYRLKEPPFVSLPALIDVLGEVILPLLDTPFAFFGHSMGAVIAFELAKYLRLRHRREPHVLFVSGRRAPQILDTDPVTYTLPKQQFVEELIRLDGTPKEILEHVELMEMMIPLLRADFQLVQTYRYVASTLLQCPIIVYGGLHDHDVPRDSLLPWRELTKSMFTLHMLPGDHFFLKTSQSILLELLAQELRETAAHACMNNS